MTSHNIKLYLAPTSQVPPRIKVSQYDKGRTLQFTILNEDGSYHSFASGVTAKIQIAKPDNKAVEYTATVSGYTVSATLQYQMSVVAGLCRGEIRLYSGSNIDIGTANFILDVEEGIIGDQTDISETVIPGWITTAKGYATEAQSWAVGGTGTRSGEDVDNSKYYRTLALNYANSAAVSASTSTTAANNAQTYAVNAAKDANSASNSATNAATSATNAKTSETNAATSATSAETSALNASKDAKSASASATNAATSATNAATSATSASGSANSASASATSASGSAATASTAANNAKASETSAATSATNAGASETNAKAYENTAETYKNNAYNYMTSAQTAASTASSSASTATTAASTASTAATTATEASNKAVSYAVGGTGTRTGEDTDNAKYYAELAEEALEDIGQFTGAFHIDPDDGHLYLTAITRMDGEFSINRSTGHMILTWAA